MRWWGEGQGKSVKKSDTVIVATALGITGGKKVWPLLTYRAKDLCMAGKSNFQAALNGKVDTESGKRANWGKGEQAPIVCGK